MAIDYTINEVIASAKRRCLVPTAQNTFQPSEFASILDEEMRTYIVPKIKAVREDYFVSFTEFSIVTGTNLYAIPQRSISAGLKDVVVFSNDNNVIQHLPLLNYTDISLYGPINNFMRLFGFYLQGNSVGLYPADFFAGKILRVYNYRRPNRLVLPTAAGKILSINAGTNEVTLDNVPTTWTASTIVDVIQGRPGFDSVVDNQTLTNVVGFTLTFSSLPSTMQIGDYVAETGESPIPQIPWEAFPWLAQRGAVKLVESLGNVPEVQTHQSKADEIEETFLTSIQPRVEDAPRKVVSRKGLFRFTRSPMWPR